MNNFKSSDVFWAPALKRPQLWRTALGAVLIVAASLLATFALFFVAAAYFGLTEDELMNGGSPLGSALAFLSFIGVHIGLLFSLWVLHKRSYRSLFGASGKVDWRHVKQGFLFVTAFFALRVLIMLAEPFVLPGGMVHPVIFGAFMPWLIWLPIAAAVIFIQISAEELFFRGYLLQQLRARSQSFFIYAALPSLLFGLLHFDAESYGILNALLYVVTTTLIGVVGCHVTLHTGNIGAMIGVHYGVNLSTLVFGADGFGGGFSLVRTTAPLDGAYFTYSLVLQAALVLWGYWIWRRKIAKV